MRIETHQYREFLSGLISPTALSVLERMSPVIYEIYQLDELLDTTVPLEGWAEREERFTSRLRRIVRMLPPDVSPMPNEVFTAIEFLVHDIHEEPIHLGLAIARLEELGAEIRSDPLLHSLVTGRAN